MLLPSLPSLRSNSQLRGFKMRMYELHFSTDSWLRLFLSGWCLLLRFMYFCRTISLSLYHRHTYPKKLSAASRDISPGTCGHLVFDCDCFDDTEIDNPHSYSIRNEIKQSFQEQPGEPKTLKLQVHFLYLFALTTISSHLHLLLSFDTVVDKSICMRCYDVLMIMGTKIYFVVLVLCKIEKALIDRRYYISHFIHD